MFYVGARRRRKKKIKKVRNLKFGMKPTVTDRWVVERSEYEWTGADEEPEDRWR